MRFLLDENVPASVAEMLLGKGHEAEFIRDHVPAGAPDPLVAAIAEQLDAVLVSFDGDFEKIAPRIPRGVRARFRHLSRIWMRCQEPRAAARLEATLDLVQTEYHLASEAERRMSIWLGESYIRTER
jgi:predicted nuclease of predicted toxin-antitoxin system